MSTARRPRTAPAGWPSRLAAAALVLGFSAAAPAAAVTIDTFTTNQANVTDPPGGGSTVATGGADIIGTRRGLVPDLLSGAGPVTGGVSGGVFTATVTATTPDSRGEIEITWDGDALPLVLTPTGLGGVDLTGSNHAGFRFLVNSATAGSELVLAVYTDGANASRAALRLPAVGAPTSFFLSYASSFVPFLGTGADFSDVGAIVLTVRGTETTTVLDLVETATPAIAATKQDRTLADVPITGPVAPGATYKYRVAITNTGTEAQTVDLADTIEPNLTITTSTIDATPALINDAYETFGNVGESDTAPGLLANDVDPDQNGTPPALAVTAGAVATTLGGSATLAADGSFTYNPPIGVGESVDTFTYTVTDNEGNVANAVATIHIGPRIWFVDSSHGGTNQGTFANPFTSITASNLNGAGGVGDLDQPGDVIFVYAGAGAYNVGLILEADQQLIGQGSGLVLQGETIVPAGAAPTFTNGAGSGITLASNNTLMGFTVGNTTVTDIVGNGFGTLTVSNVTLNGNGGALDLATGALDATFNSISSTNAPVHGINLNAATGTLAVTGGTSVTDAAQAGIRVVNGGSIYSFGATTLTSTGFGLDLSNNPTSTFNFTSLAVTTDAGAGLVAANSGTLNISGSGNTIVATGGAAVDITSTSLGSGATFSTVSSSGSPGKGVNLDTVAGAFVANGGAISNASGVCFDVNGGSSNITFAGTVTCTAANRLVEITGRTGGTVTLSGNLSGTGSSTGINIANNSVSGSPIINLTGASKVLNTGANAAVTLDNNDVATINFTGGGLDIDTTSGAGFNAINGAVGITVQGSGNSITSTTGTALNVATTTIGASGLTFQSIASNGASSGIILSSTGGLGGLTVTGNSAGLCGGQVGSGPPASPATTTAPVVGDCTGGTIQASTGPGIVLTNTNNVSLTRMRILGSGDDGIQGTNVTGFQLTSSLLDNNGNGLNENNIDFGGNSSLTPEGLRGTGSITDSTLRDGYDRGLSVRNINGAALTSFNVTGSQIRGRAAENNNNDGILFEALGTASITASVSGSFFAANKGDHFQAAGVNSGTLNLTFTNNTLTGGHSSALGQGITINAATGVAFGGWTGRIDYDVNGNNINGAISNGVSVVLGTSGATGVFDGFVRNNVIGTAGVALSCSTQANGVYIDKRGNGTQHSSVTGNTIRQCFDRGILSEAGDGSGVLNLTVQSNLVDQQVDAAAREAIQTNFGITSTNVFGVEDAPVVCLQLGGAGALANTFSHGGGAPDDFRLRKRFSATVRLPGYAGGTGQTAGDLAQVVTFVQGQNSGSAGEPGSASASGAGGGYTGGAGCTLPTL